jgi:hypothetical protein
VNIDGIASGVSMRCTIASVINVQCVILDRDRRAMAVVSAWCHVQFSPVMPRQM